ncbi:MAG: ABC transporter ATP-binding protein, partial [Lachnospiraceae bacterium]|nr:ABC transporter ATP-binding protein [Lachnospiraceae bacterium]
MKNDASRKTIRRVLRYIKKYRIYVILSLVLALVTVATTLYAPILVGYAIDEIVGAGEVHFDALLAILKKIAIVIGITGVSQWLMNLCNNRITFRVVKDVRTRAFFHLENLPLRYVDSHQYGDIVSRVIADVDQFSDGLLMGFTQFFTGILTIFGTLGFMIWLDIRIALVVVLV